MFISSGRLIIPISPIIPMKTSTLFNPRCCQLLAVAAFVDKTAFKTGYLLIQQVVCLVDQADEGVGGYSRIRVFQPGGVRRVERSASRKTDSQRLEPIRYNHPTVMSYVKAKAVQ